MSTPEPLNPLEFLDHEGPLLFGASSFLPAPVANEVTHSGALRDLEQEGDLLPRNPSTPMGVGAFSPTPPGAAEEVGR